MTFEGEVSPLDYKVSYLGSGRPPRLPLASLGAPDLSMAVKALLRVGVPIPGCCFFHLGLTVVGVLFSPENFYPISDAIKVYELLSFMDTYLGY